MQAGDTFLLSNHHNPKLHLYVILSRPNPSGKILCVSFSSSYPSFRDKACVIQPGQYAFPFIIRETFVDYGQAKEIDTTMLRVNIAERRWTRGDPVPAALLRRIKEGAKKSGFLATKFRSYFSLF